MEIWIVLCVALLVSALIMYLRHKPKSCLVLHNTGALEQEIWGSIQSDSIKEHVQHCAKFFIDDRNQVKINSHYNELVSANRREIMDLTPPREGDTELFAYELELKGKVAGARSTTILHCSNAPWGMNNQHDWMRHISGDRFCINCGIRVKGL